jgi:hypothetical protein
VFDAILVFINEYSHVLLVVSYSIARIFRNSRVHRQMEGGLYATEVLGLPTGEIVTGSANYNIVIYDEAKIVKTITKAHEQPIRKLVVHPLGFASVANDGYAYLLLFFIITFVLLDID